MYPLVVGVKRNFSDVSIAIMLQGWEGDFLFSWWAFLENNLHNKISTHIRWQEVLACKIKGRKPGIIPFIYRDISAQLYFLVGPTCVAFAE